MLLGEPAPETGDRLEGKTRNGANSQSLGFPRPGSALGADNCPQIILVGAGVLSGDQNRAGVHILGELCGAAGGVVLVSHTDGLIAALEEVLSHGSPLVAGNDVVDGLSNSVHDLDVGILLVDAVTIPCSISAWLVVVRAPTITRMLALPPAASAIISIVV